MPTPPGDYYRYFPISPDARLWGLGVTGAGFTDVRPGSRYPASGHPQDRHFDWANGRVLDTLQIVLISSGRGWLETRATGRRRIEAGMAFLLLPKVWHRYRPDPDTGWQESWIEVQGPVVDNLLSGGVFPAKSALKADAIASGLDSPLESIHREARKDIVDSMPDLSAFALQAIALCARLNARRKKLSPIQATVRTAEKHLIEHHHEEINIEALARELGVAYSHFRRAFCAQTGLAPWRYVIQLRLRRARRLLASTDAKLDEIARQVGFSNGFQFSIAFKRAYGESPSVWRRSCQQGS